MKIGGDQPGQRSKYEAFCKRLEILENCVYRMGSKEAVAALHGLSASVNFRRVYETDAFR